MSERLASLLPGMLSRLGFSVTLQSYSAGAGGDFAASDGTWADVASFPAVWDTSSGYGSERLGDGRAQSQSRLGILIAYRDDIKDASSVGNKRISYNGTTYNIAAVQMVGARVGLRLTLEDGSAQ